MIWYQVIGAAKTAWRFWWYISGKSLIQKIFEGEILFRCQPTHLFQLFCKNIINSKVIFKSIIGPDDTRKGDHHSLMGYFQN